MSDIQGFDKLYEKLGRFRDVFQRKTQDFIIRLMKKQIDMMLERTDRGVDINGAPFKPYSADYIAYKRKVRGSAPDWWRLSGTTLNSLVVRLINANTGEVMFGRKEGRERMMLHDSTRPFFGVNNQENKKLVSYFAQLIRKEVLNVFR